MVDGVGREDSVNGLVDWPKFAHFCIRFRGVLTKDPIQSELLLENFEANSYGLIPRLSSRCLAANQLLARPCQAWAPLGRGYRGTDGQKQWPKG